MKIVICYPPLDNRKGAATLGQNRQFQYFRDKTCIYPVVPACAATLLKQAGHEVIWLDCIAQDLDYKRFLKIIEEQKPDLIAFETKTPVIKQHWKIMDDLKRLFSSQRQGQPPAGTVPVFVLFGDHVTALPEESLQNSQVDFVLTGGDYDFLLLNLCNSLQSFPLAAEPSLLKLEPGIFYRDNGQIKNTGRFQLDHDLNALPFIDRDLTKWRLYAFENGNYKRTPGTSIMSGRDCWWGKCSFCSWPTLYPSFRVRTVNNVLDELASLVERYRVREVMDDTGSLPAGEWLDGFCSGIIDRELNRKIFFDCNIRFGALSSDDFRLMKKANFRLLLFGLESANQGTLDKLNKGVKLERIIQDCKAATGAGLFPHITVMFGYPWETYEEALKTLRVGKWLLKKGYAYTMQATIAIPYPGTALFQECKEKGLLKTLDWDDYDMKQPIMKSGIPEEKLMRLVRGMYRVSFNPEFILRKLFSLRDLDDMNYCFRAGKKVLGHIFDFRNSRVRYKEA